MIKVMLTECSLLAFGIVLPVFGVQRVLILFVFGAVNIGRAVKVGDFGAGIITHGIGYHQCIGRFKGYIVPEVRIARKGKIIAVFAQKDIVLVYQLATVGIYTDAGSGIVGEMVCRKSSVFVNKLHMVGKDGH